MAQNYEIEIDTGLVKVVFTDSSDGDFQVDSRPDQLSLNRSKVIDLPWTWVRQVHGKRVVVVGQPGEAAGEEADGVVTAAVECPISVTTADCSPVVLVGSNAVAALHAGWRGLEAGIIESGAKILTELGAKPVTTFLGAHITSANYEFGAADIDRIANLYGNSVRSSTLEGLPALDMYAGVSAACEIAGWPVPEVAPCTSSTNWFSHRLRSDSGRQAAVAWITK